MEEKTIKLAEGIIESCIASYYILEYLNDFKDEDKVYVEGVRLALKGTLYPSWRSLKKNHGKRELKKIVYGHVITDKRREAFEYVDALLQDYHNDKYKR
jgi:hypothetical protein